MKNIKGVLIAIIVILVIALSIITFQYFKMKNIAEENLKNYLNVKRELYLLQHPDATIDN